MCVVCKDVNISLFDTVVLYVPVSILCSRYNYSCLRREHNNVCKLLGHKHSLFESVVIYNRRKLVFKLYFLQLRTWIIFSNIN